MGREAEGTCQDSGIVCPKIRSHKAVEHPGIGGNFPRGEAKGSGGGLVRYETGRSLGAGEWDHSFRGDRIVPFS